MVSIETSTKSTNQQEVYYETAAPTPEDDVPILLENKGFFRLFEPIMRLYMLPKIAQNYTDSELKEVLRQLKLKANF